MRGIIAYFIRYPVAANLLMFAILLFGWMSLRSMQSTYFPEVESLDIKIEIVWPGASPEEVEEGAIIKIENNLKSVSGIDQVTSVSKENGGNITVTMDEGYDMDQGLEDVQNAVNRINSFPLDMEPVVVYHREQVQNAITFALSGELDLKTLKQYARQIEDDLRAIPGISKVELKGFPAEEIEIGLREEALRAYGLTQAQVADAVRRHNVEITGGTVKGPREELLIRVRNKSYDANELNDVIVKATADGRMIRLKDVAEPANRWADVPASVTLNARPTVVVNVQNTIYEDILHITDEVKKYVENFNAAHADVKADVLQDNSITLRQRIDLLVENGVMGGILVLLFLALFLKPELAFWVAAGLPISFLGMFIFAVLYGLTINVMSLFGMILVVGILVDDAIVITENIYQHYERGKPPIEAAIEGTMEVLPSVVSAVLTTMIAFATFFFLDGRLGDFASSMAFVVIVSLGVSLLEGMFILPSHMAHARALKRPPGEENRFERVMNRFFLGWLRDRVYAPALRFCLSNNAVAIATPVALLMICVAMIQGGLVKTTFFPNIERDEIDVSLELPAGTSERVTQAVVERIERGIWKANDSLKKTRPDRQDVVLAVQRNMGPGTHQAALVVYLMDTETRNLSVYTVSDALRSAVGLIPEADKLAFGAQSAFGKPVSVSLLGSNLKELSQAKEELKAQMNAVSALKDVTDSDVQGNREVVIRLKEKAYMLGLTIQDVVGQVRQGFFGNEIQRLQRGIDEVRVWARFTEDERDAWYKLADMRIRAAGAEYPLSELAEFEIERGIIAINHLDGKREIRVEADIANPKESVTDLVAAVQNDMLPPILAKYPSVRAGFEGQSRQTAKTAESFGRIGPIIGLLFLAIITITFRSFLQTVVVVLLIPFGFSGVIIGHYIHGAPISMLSFYGIIALIGVMVNDSLVFVSSYNQYLKEGLGVREALERTGVSRFRPIMLTSLTTVAGLGPLIAEKSFGAQFLIPMAISAAYGLAAATFLTLLMLPSLLYVFNYIKVYLNWLWTGRRPAPEAVEPAVQEMEFEHGA